MINQWLLEVANLIQAQETSQMLLSSYYLWSWIESTHVLTLMICIGCLFIIDFRILGWTLTKIPASTVADRLHNSMMIAFAIMFITGLLLVYAKPVETIQSLWFRIKILLILLAGINAWIFNRRLKQARNTWDRDSIAPMPLRAGAAISLCLWCTVITFGRYIPYDWFDCVKTESTVILWAAGCVDQLQSL